MVPQKFAKLDESTIQHKSLRMFSLFELQLENTENMYVVFKNREIKKTADYTFICSPISC